jgi:GNAT superfamily N-acetyltransferase
MILSMVENVTYRVSAMPGSVELASIVQRLLGLLPSWFDTPEANEEYVASAHRLPGLVAYAGTDAVGILLHRRHSPSVAEIHLMAVDPSWHRRGVGRTLVDALETSLAAEDIPLLQVKTGVHAREFYRSVGFLPQEEMLALGPGNLCLIMVKKLS